jgi:hypothetical protein
MDLSKRRSWAPTEGSVDNAFLPMHSNIRQLEVLEAHIDLVSENPYGQVVAIYELANRLTTAKILHQERPTLLLPDAAGDYTSLQ